MMQPPCVYSIICISCAISARSAASKVAVASPKGDVGSIASATWGRWAADDLAVGERGPQVTQLRAGQHQVGPGEAIYEEFANQRRRGAMRRWQPGQHRVGLGDSVTDALRLAIERLPGGFMAFVPGGRRQ